MLVIVTVCFDDVRTGTLPKATGIGATDMLGCGWPVSVKLTGLPDSPTAVAVTLFGPGVEPKFNATEASPPTSVLTPS